VKKYVLIKEYNSAYDYWLRAHLREKRIFGDREYSWKEAQGIIMDMDARGVHDDFFQKYFWSWANHPEHPPDYFSLLCMTLPIYKDDKPDLLVTAQLDGEASKRNQKILFTIEDVAQDFYNFYDRFLIKPLARALERGAEGNKLSNYFEYEEFARVPDPRIHGQEKVEYSRQEIATDLLQRFRTITPEKILVDIEQTLNQHYDKGLAAASLERSYNYKSEYVQISANKARGPDKQVTTFLTPARSCRAIREGYEGVYYPTYYVEVAPL